MQLEHPQLLLIRLILILFLSGMLIKKTILNPYTVIHLNW